MAMVIMQSNNLLRHPSALKNVINTRQCLAASRLPGQTQGGTRRFTSITARPMARLCHLVGDCLNFRRKEPLSLPLALRYIYR